jgi:hypothetical protein
MIYTKGPKTPSYQRGRRFAATVDMSSIATGIRHPSRRFAPRFSGTRFARSAWFQVLTQSHAYPRSRIPPRPDPLAWIWTLPRSIPSLMPVKDLNLAFSSFYARRLGFIPFRSLQCQSPRRVFFLFPPSSTRIHRSDRDRHREASSMASPRRCPSLSGVRFTVKKMRSLARHF